MSLVLKSNVKYTGGTLFPEFDIYKQRVLADGGVIESESATIEAMIFARRNGFLEGNGFSATSMQWGHKLKSDGTIAKMYSLFGADGDIYTYSGSFGKVSGDKGAALLLGGNGDVAISDAKIKSNDIMMLQAVTLPEGAWNKGYTRYGGSITRLMTDMGVAPEGVYENAALIKPAFIPSLSTLSAAIYKGIPLTNQAVIHQIDLTPEGLLTEELKVSGNLLNPDGSSKLWNDNKLSLIWGVLTKNKELMAWLDDGKHLPKVSTPFYPTFEAGVTGFGAGYTPWRVMLTKYNESPNYPSTGSSRGLLLGQLHETWVALDATEQQFKATGERLYAMYYS